MKKLVILSFLLIAVFSFNIRTDAQVRVNVNINSQPEWGPVGYDRVEYYYLPDIESYYYVPRHQFVYFSNGRWVFSSYLPSRYRNYDLYSGYKVVVNRPDAYRYYDQDRVRYEQYRNYYGKQQSRGNHGNGRGHDKDRDRDRGRHGHK